jgi:transketolase
MNIQALEKTALSVRSLTMDAIQAANSGHPGLPMGCAELGAYLYGYAMKYDPAAPAWLDRDRFVLSGGHGSMFLYSMLHLAGFGIELDEIRKFRQIGSRCAGHPEYASAPGIETTTGPLGQGIATAIGMAVAERMMAAKFNTPARKIVDHYTYALAGDGCFQEGVSAEASSLAGHLKLDKLVVFYDSNRITIDGSTDISFSEDVGARYEAYGWKVLRGSMYDFNGLARLLAEAKAVADKPKLVILTSVIGKGAPTKQGTHGVHGAPLGEEEIAKAKANLGIPADAKFHVAPEAYAFFEARRAELAAARAVWEKDFEAWKSENPALAQELALWLSGAPVHPLAMPEYKEGEKIATRNASGKALAAVAAAWPNLVGGSADLTVPNVSQIPAVPGCPANVVFSASNPGGRMIHFGVREHGMAAIANGIALHGGFRPFVATFLVFADYLRPALRLAALMKQPVIYVLTHDSIFVGEDGPTHQPIEQLASLRAIPNVTVLRPADAQETVAAWKMAMEKKDGPVVIALSRQNLPVFPKADPDWRETMKVGAYVVRNPATEPDIVLVATGSEVALALEAVDLAQAAAGSGGIASATAQARTIRVVSVTSRETFYAAPAPVREAIGPKSARVVVAEAGIAMGWERLAEPEDILSLERFGESGPGDQVARHLGLTARALADIILR